MEGQSIFAAVMVAIPFGIVAMIPTYLLLRTKNGGARGLGAYVVGIAAGIGAAIVVAALVEGSVESREEMLLTGMMGALMGPLFGVRLAKILRVRGRPGERPRA